MALRTRSGRLPGGVRRALTGKAKPGQVILLDKFRRRKKGKLIPNSIQADFSVQDSLAFDLDCRKLVEHVTIRLATHFQRSLLLGVRPDGSGPVPELAAKTLAIDDARGESRVGEFGVKTGFLARNWTLGKIVGSSVKARRQIKPNGAEGRSFQINKWLDRTTNRIDLQSVDGTAAVVIATALQEFVDASFGKTVGTPKIPRTLAGTLPVLKR